MLYTFIVCICACVFYLRHAYAKGAYPPFSLKLSAKLAKLRQFITTHKPQ